jgi:hypothetical protein
MNLTISYAKISNDWYVQRLYQDFHKELLKNTLVCVEYIEIRELEKKYHFNNSGYYNNRPSIFNIYNLLLFNKDNNKLFLHSLNDFSPVILDNIDHIRNLFDLILFSCSSNLSTENYEKYSKYVKILPSFYILENYSDHELINKYRNNNKHENKLYFNGLIYGERICIKNVLEDSIFFDFRNKDIDFMEKNSYFNKISNYKYGLSVNGAAKICYRDLEYFGMGILNLREKLDIKFNDPLIENVHYFNIFDVEIKSILCDNNKKKYIKEKIENNVIEIINNNDVDLVIKNANDWFLRNATIDNQVKIMISFLNEFKIFI